MSILDFASRIEGGTQRAELVLKLDQVIGESRLDLCKDLGVIGIGLLVVPFHGPTGLAITIFVDESYVPLMGVRRFAYLRDILVLVDPRLFTFLSGLAGDLLEYAILLRLPAPELYFGEGDPIQTSSAKASAGCSLTWSGGNGFSTAGHAVPSVGTSFYHGGSAVGSVVWSNNPAGCGNSPQADFAVVELARGITFTQTHTTYRSALPYDAVTMIGPGASRSGSSVILGMMVAMGHITTNATIGDVYLTSSSISGKGDSGSPAVTSAGELIGHVIGGSAGLMTFVQDVSYQINAASVGLPGLRI